MRPVAKPTIAQYNMDDYDVLRTYLFANLDAYCSYCEAPISNDSAVEHKVPKNAADGFPAFGTQWRNLLIACQSCNSAKGHKPSRLGAANPGNTAGYYLNTLDLWVWPDSTGQMPQQPPLPVDESYQLFTFDYSAQSQVQLSNAGLVRPSTVQVTMPWATTPYTMLWVVPNPANVLAGSALETRVQATIQGLNLNYFNVSDPTYNDRRVVNRTAALNTANVALANLQAVLQAVGNNLAAPNVLLMIQAVRQTAIATGFWSVWFGVFRAALDHPAGGSYWAQFNAAQRLSLLEALLIYYVSPAERANATDLIFAGTDVARLHLATFA